MPIRGWALFAALSLLWGVIYLLLKVLGDDIAPATLTFLRCVLAAALLFPLALRAGTLPSLRVHWRALLTMALLGVVIPFVSLAAGVNHVTSGLASILGATTPILIVLLAIPFDRSERVGMVQALGLLVGISGIVLLFGGGVAGDSDAVLGAALVLFASLVYAGATLYYKHAFHDLHPVGLMSWVFLLSAVLLAVPAALDPPARVPHADELGVDRRARRLLLRRRLRPLLRAGRPRRRRARVRLALRLPGDRGRAGRDRARRGADRDVGGRAPARGDRRAAEHGRGCE